MLPDGNGRLVALTGASGFVGSAIAEALVKAGFRVRALSSTPSQASGAAVTLPAPDAPLDDFRRALDGADHLVHAGARNNADKRLGLAAYHGPNVALSAGLAQAAADVVPGRTVFLSSIRAVVGPTWCGTISDATPEAPNCPYGRSKREAELACLSAFEGKPNRLGILRLAPVYGLGMKGNLGLLLRLADTPWPLPLGSLPGRRSLLSRDAAASAVVHLLGMPTIPFPTMLASDLAPASPTAVVSAFRRGLNRPLRIFSVPPAAIQAAARLRGRAEWWAALTATQICSPQRLSECGWTAPQESLSGLAAAAAAAKRKPG